jgi:hypothetical protein
MKVGLSLSRCVKDIFDKRVDDKDVLAIIARTDFDPENDSQWTQIWNGYGGGNSRGSVYSQPEWSSIPAEDEQKLRDIILDLYNAGKIHQPRQFGAFPPRLDFYWYDLILTPDGLADNPAAEEAWNNYKIAAKLGSVKQQNLIFNDDF